MNLNAYAGIRALLRLILRRDWLVLSVCVILPVFFAVVTVATFNQLLPSLTRRGISPLLTPRLTGMAAAALCRDYFEGIVL